MANKSSLLQDMIAIRRSERNVKKNSNNLKNKSKICLIGDFSDKFLNNICKFDYDIVNFTDDSLYKEVSQGFYKSEGIEILRGCDVAIISLNSIDDIESNLLIGVLVGINEMIKYSNMTRFLYNEFADRVEDETDIKEPIRAIIDNPIKILALQELDVKENMVLNSINKWGKVFNNEDDILSYLK